MCLLNRNLVQKTKETKRSRRKPVTLLSNQKGFDSSQVTKATTIFEALRICVVSGTKEHSKNDLENLVAENGAECIQKEEKADLLVAGNPNLRLRSLINSGKYNILSYQFILDCVKEKDLLDIEPKYIVHTIEETNRSLMQYIDEWGDSYTTPTTEIGLRRNLEEMTDSFNDIDEEACRKLACSFSEKYFDNQLPGMLFLKTVAYFDYDESVKLSAPLTTQWVQRKKAWDELELSAICFKSEGGIIAQEISESITHVIFNKNDLARLKTLIEMFKNPPLPRFVSSEWIDACIKHDTLIDENEFKL
ncbi:hypothetical protein BY458DRAFT_506157 [Sporodiniella umbellata]|nr:hypothetical protein BY458DRAFT_506157 [Sporodiniella umbellata]